MNHNDADRPVDSYGQPVGSFEAIESLIRAVNLQAAYFCPLQGKPQITIFFEPSRDDIFELVDFASGKSARILYGAKKAKRSRG